MKNNLLFISPEKPDLSGTGLQKRIHSILLCLKNQFNIFGFFIGDIDIQSSLFKDIKSIPTPIVYQDYNGFKRLVLSIFSKYPEYVRDYLIPNLSQIISDWNHINFDIIWLERLMMAPLANHFTKSKVIIDLDDIEGKKIFQVLKYKNKPTKISPWFWYPMIEAFRLKRYENKILKTKYAKTVSNVNDYKELRKQQYPSVFLVENKLDLSYYFKYDRSESKNKTIILTGLFDYFPNRDAFYFFYNKIWPLVKKCNQEIKWLIVGKNDKIPVHNIEKKEPQIKFTGWVKDIRPYLNSANISIIPLRIGGGTRYKILESIAMGVPVVSTSIGADGLPDELKQYVKVADEPEDFAYKIINLLENNTKLDMSLSSILDYKMLLPQINNIFKDFE